jgi:hypothetical protein
MRYLKLIVVAIIAAWLVFELVVNLESLRGSFSFTLAIPLFPLGSVIMPIWLALLIAFTIAFIIAIILEIGAWYQYTRLIRLQRKQILALQDALDLKKNSDPARPS